MSVLQNRLKQKIKNITSYAHIGMRKWKSLLAIFVSFWLWQLIRIPFPELEVHPIYMYIYGLLEIRDSSQKTVQLGGSRIKANVCAFLVGIPLMLILDLLKNCAPEGWIHIAIELLFIMIGVIITITVAQKLGCDTFCGVAAIIYIILIVSHCDEGRYIYCLLRAAQTVMAVLIAWILNVKLFPYPRKQKQDKESHDSKNENN